MLKLIKSTLKYLNETGTALPVSYVPTNLNPADGLTRASLLSPWRETFPDLSFGLVPPNNLYGYEAILNAHYHISRMGKNVKRGRVRKAGKKKDRQAEHTAAKRRKAKNAKG
jgi:hypothetical protein